MHRGPRRRVLTAGTLVGFALLLGGVVPGAALAAPAPATASVTNGQVRLEAASSGMAIEYSPGTYAGSVDTYVRFRSLTPAPITAAGGCASQADGWVACGDHTSTQLTIDGSQTADNTILFAPGGTMILPWIIVRAGSGDDVIIGGPEDWAVFAGDGRNYVDGGAGIDVVWGGSGDDILRGGSGSNEYRGGAGTNLIEGGDGPDYLYPSTGDDIANGGAGADTLRGGDGNDILIGGSGANTIVGGNDTDFCDSGTECETVAAPSELVPPAIAVAFPNAGQHLGEGSNPAASAHCSDTGGSLLRACQFPPVVRTGPGDAVFAAGAGDNAGNLSFALAPYTVDFAGASPGLPGAVTTQTPATPVTQPVGASTVFTIDRRLPYVSPTRLKTGRRANAKLGRWKPRHSYGLRYQWQLCDDQGQGCTDLPGAQRRQLALTSAMAGHRLRFRVTARVRRSAPVSTTSQPSEIVQGTTPVNVTPPRISGRPRVGKTLFAKKGVWNPRGWYTYQWLRCDDAGEACEPIPGATRVTWRVTDEDVGQTLKVQVTAKSHTDRTTAVALSPATAVITD